MAHYIDKDALVVEIERIKKEECPIDTYEGKIKLFYFERFLSFIKSLEVKEVNLEKEIKSYFKGFGKFPSVGIDDCIDIAKHFFELGLRSTITEEDCKLIWNIGDDIPYMPEEEFFKELLRRYKIKKGE